MRQGIRSVSESGLHTPEHAEESPSKGKDIPTMGEEFRNREVNALTEIKLLDLPQ
jgi:hypothetical protein